MDRLTGGFALCAVRASGQPRKNVIASALQRSNLVVRTAEHGDCFASARNDIGEEFAICNRPVPGPAAIGPRRTPPGWGGMSEIFTGFAVFGRIASGFFTVRAVGLGHPVDLALFPVTAQGLHGFWQTTT